MHIETIFTTVNYLEKLRLHGEDETLNKLILFWKIQANQYEGFAKLPLRRVKRVEAGINKLIDQIEAGEIDYKDYRFHVNLLFDSLHL